MKIVRYIMALLLILVATVVLYSVYHSRISLQEQTTTPSNTPAAAKISTQKTQSLATSSDQPAFESRSSHAANNLKTDSAAKATEAKTRLMAGEFGRALFLTKIQSESLEDSIRKLGEEPVSELFQSPLFLSDLSSISGIEECMMRDPRVAKVANAVKTGSADQRNVVVDLIAIEIGEYLESLSLRARGDFFTRPSTELNAGMAFPIILAMADYTGDSLPILVEWYQLEKLASENRWQDLKSTGNLPADFEIPTDTKTLTMTMLASAIVGVFENMGLENHVNEFILPVTQSQLGLKTILPHIDQIKTDQILNLATEYTS